MLKDGIMQVTGSASQDATLGGDLQARRCPVAANAGRRELVVDPGASIQAVSAKL